MTKQKSVFAIAKSLYKEYGDVLSEEDVGKIASSEGVDGRLLNRRYRMVIDLAEHHGMIPERRGEEKQENSEN